MTSHYFDPSPTEWPPEVTDVRKKRTLGNQKGPFIRGWRTNYNGTLVSSPSPVDRVVSRTPERGVWIEERKSCQGGLGIYHGRKELRSGKTRSKRSYLKCRKLFHHPTHPRTETLQRFLWTFPHRWTLVKNRDGELGRRQLTVGVEDSEISKDPHLVQHRVTVVVPESEI